MLDPPPVNVKEEDEAPLFTRPRSVERGRTPSERSMVEKLTWPQHLASLLAVVTIFMAGFLIGSNYLRPDPNVIEDAARCNKELVRAMSAHGQGQVAYENQDWKTLGKVRDEEAAHLREMGVACWPKER